jgi:serine phosphatase RsbU (regulator of sigma subunit)
VTVPEDDVERTVFRPSKPAPTAAGKEIVGHYLVVVEGAEQGRRVGIDAEGITLGRDPQQTLVFADPELSRRHARVLLVNDEPVVQDLGSTNGTFLNGRRLTAPTKLRESHVLRIGSQVLRYERRSRRDVEREEELARDLRKASGYVASLLPAPRADGPIQAEWRFVPSTQLGGDAFGYGWMDPYTFVCYLLDVSGHGVQSAMHSTAVLNVLRQRALPHVDFTDPAAVLASLNKRFQMEDHNDLFFTIWYGVYNLTTRALVCACAGHHPAYLVTPDRQTLRPVGTAAPMIGAFPDMSYDVETTTLPPDAALYLFSDGAFEIETPDNGRWALGDFLPLLTQPPVTGTPESERIYTRVKQAAKPGPLADDFSLVVLNIP